MKTIAALILIVGVAAAVAKYEDKFINYGVYSIKNRALDKQLLTFIQFNQQGNITIASTPEMQFAVGSEKEGWGQRWRLDKSAFYTAFEMRPVLNEKYVLEYVPDQGALRWFSGLGNNKLWYLQDAGDDFTFVKNKQSNACLQALENNVTVIARDCNGSPFQQWQFDNKL